MSRNVNGGVRALDWFNFDFTFYIISKRILTNVFGNESLPKTYPTLILRLCILKIQEWRLLSPLIGAFWPQTLDTATEQMLKLTSVGYVHQSQDELLTNRSCARR